MVEAREGPGLELEALEEALILFQVGEEGLEGDLAAEGLLGRAVHDGHSAGAEALVDVVVADSRAGEVLAGACVLHSEQKDRRRPLDLTSPSGGTRPGFGPSLPPPAAWLPPPTVAAYRARS